MQLIDLACFFGRRGVWGEERAVEHLFWLSDTAWAAVNTHLPHGRPGKPRVDDRRVVSGILHVLKTGLPLARCARRVWAAYDDL